MKHDLTGKRFGSLVVLEDAGKERYWERINAGLCTFCGIAPARPGKRMCFKCALVNTEYKRSRRTPTGRPIGRSREYLYSVSSPEGEPLFEGFAEDAAKFCGMKSSSIHRAARLGRRLTCGYTVERRRIGDGDED